jgi:WD40 repeat protein
LFNENRVVIHDQETGHQKMVEITKPWKCTSSQYFLVVTAVEDGLHLFTIDGVLVHIVPDSKDARCVAFHPHNTDILAIGYKDGSVRVWHVSTQSYGSTFKEHTDLISNIRFAPDCRLILSSWDNTASIVTLDDQFQLISLKKFKGHTDRVTDILPLLSSKQCVTCSDDYTLNVWNCQTGACLRTLTDHTYPVTSLAMHPNGQYYASGSQDRTVIIWSSETFEAVRRIDFPKPVASLIIDESNTLHVGVYLHGVMSCNVLTGEVGSVIIPETKFILGLALGKTPLMAFTKQAAHSHL